MERKKPQIGELLFREFSINSNAINIDARTVELAFSSETVDVQRYYGIEILDHTPKSVRLGRLNDGGALLVNHDSDQQVGVVEKAEIDQDRVGRAVVRFGKGAAADVIFQDVVDGIRRKVSVGYLVYGMVLESSKDGTDTYRITDWEPTEISIVAVPADTSVGVGRSEVTQPTRKEPAMTKTDPASPETKDPVIQVDRNAVEAEYRAKELKRMSDIEAIGEKFKELGGAELSREAMVKGWTPEQLNAALLERAGSKKPVPSGTIGMTERETKDYSFLRALHALANPTDKRAQEAAGFEREVSDEASKKLGRAAQGLIVPYDVLVMPAKRDLVVGTGTAGGHTVATNLLAGSFIDMLRKRMVMNSLGATILNGLVGNIAIPRQTSGATAYWVAESGAPTESQQAFDQVTMSPKTVGAFTDYSRKLLLQSSIDVENFVRMDLVKQIGLEIDRVSFYGTGSSNQPQGLRGLSGINTVDFAAVKPTWAEIVQLETEVAADNADIGTLAYAINARTRGALKTTEKATNTAQFIMGSDAQVNGYRTEVSNQINGTAGSTEDVFFGNWSDAMIGFWSGLDLTVDPYSMSTSGTVRVVALQDVDVGFRHPESFCLGANTL